MPSPSLVVSAVGATAHAAVRAGGGVTTVIAPLSASVYCRVGDEIVWLGARHAPLHPRAVLTEAPVAEWTGVTPGDVLRLDVTGVAPWTPEPLPVGPRARTALSNNARALLRVRTCLGPPDGFGRLLDGQSPAFPLHQASGQARALARAIHADDADAAAMVAIGLLGLGAGLTPSGDDLVGGMFFARRVISELEGRQPTAWDRAAGRVVAAARARTHSISAALLSDMLGGAGHAPLHTLVAALAADTSLESAQEAARALTRLGHSSGWDMLAGLLGGLLGPSAFA
jgi:Protein of unknown function (DUF2877)